MAENIFCYQVGDYWIILESTVTPELLLSNQIYPVPFAPDWCVGLTAVHGDLIPTVNMHKVLLKGQQPAKSYLLYIEQDSVPPLVLSCDSLPQQLALTESTDQEKESVSVSGLPGWVSGAYRQDEYLLLAADHKRLFRMLNQRKGSTSLTTRK